jgi:hypothetical protein
MVTKSGKNSDFEDIKLNIRIKLIGLWSVLVFLYIYCDIFTFFRPGLINEIIEGFMGPFQANQISLLVAGLLMAIPILIIIANLFTKLPIIRWINILGGILYTLVNIGNLVSEKWAYYWFYGVIELFITILIITQTIKWPKKI